MESLVQIPKELFAVLEQETALIEDLIVLAERQQMALTHYAIEDLQTCLAEQAEYFKHLRLVERQRVRIVGTMLNKPFSEANRVTISQICEQTSRQEGEHLRRLQSTLQLRTLKLQQLNNLNRMLTERSRSFMRTVLDTLTNGGQPLYNRRM